MKAVVGSGWWCDVDPHPWAIGSPRTRTAAFFSLWRRQVELCLAPDRIVVVDSASPVKPAPDMRAGIEWIELDRNYGSANAIREGRIKTKFSGFTRSVILGATYAIACDADVFVYVEQDCLLRGDNILERAIGDSHEDILIGGPTINGVGLDGGVAAEMLQQSLMIVKRSGLARFLDGILTAPWTDGEVSPEETMRLQYAPLGRIRIPYGRSRPIDFSSTHFYAQHLSETELDAFCQAEGWADLKSNP